MNNTKKNKIDRVRNVIRKKIILELDYTLYNKTQAHKAYKLFLDMLTIYREALNENHHRNDVTFKTDVKK